MKDTLKMRIGPNGDELGVGRKRHGKSGGVGEIERDCMGEMADLALPRIGVAAMPVRKDYERERQHRDGKKDRHNALGCVSTGRDRRDVLRAHHEGRTAETSDVRNGLPAIHGQRIHQRLQDRSRAGIGLVSTCRMNLFLPILV